MSTDTLLDSFMPDYDIVERHHIDVAAPATLTFAAAREQDLLHISLVRLIFKARELVLGADPPNRPQLRGLLAAAHELGWGVLAEQPDREIVMGAVTRPWEANVTFRGDSTSRLRVVLRTGPGQDRLDVPCRSANGADVGLLDGNTCGRDRRTGSCAVPPVLGVRLARHLAHPPALAGPIEARRRTALPSGARGVTFED